MVDDPTVVFIDVKILNPGQYEPTIIVALRLGKEGALNPNERFELTFSDDTIPRNFKTAWLGALLLALQKTEIYSPLIICTRTPLLAQLLITKRLDAENDMANPAFSLLNAAIAQLNEWTQKVQFKHILHNLASVNSDSPLHESEIDTTPDIMFYNPGILLRTGTQRLFSRILKMKYTSPYRKSSFVNVERVRDTISEVANHTPSNAAIWKAIRSRTFPVKIRDLLWKCFHNTFRVGEFWDHIENLEKLGECPICKVPETLEHSMLSCSAPEREMIWLLTEQLWSMKFEAWPKITWGLVLGSNLMRFQTKNGKPMPHKERLFSILLSTAWYTIWNMRVERRIRTPGKQFEVSEIHNRWLKTINGILQRERILTDKLKFGSLGIDKQVVLNTWSGLLLDEDSLPDDWLKERGVLVGILPMKLGVG